MPTVHYYQRAVAIAFKVIVIFLGLAFFAISSVVLIQSLLSSSFPADISFSFFVDLFAALVSLISGVTLMSLFPEAVRIRFIRPSSTAESRPTYGFSSLLAIGVGTTIGSPLFIILPINVVEFAIVSVVSLIVAGFLSVLIARIYSFMFVFTTTNEIEGIGGPGFVKASTSDRSARYFVSRLSMWIANTALAAFSAIYLVSFSLSIFPQILALFGVSGNGAVIVISALLGLFIFWFIINSFFERRYLRLIGLVQIALLAVMVIIILLQGTLLGFAGHWNLSGLLNFGTGNIGFEILENTSYLFILFFGFQEIQAMVKETKDYSRIPIISRLRGNRSYHKTVFVPAAMYATVLISLAIMLFDALTVYSVHPSPADLQGAQIPALYLVGKYISPRFELVVGMAFVIAAVTTFIPAFIAASRHLRALSNDGFFPRSMRSASWLFTLILILLLVLTNPNFLVNITDFMVLVALGIISLSPYWLRRITDSVRKRTAILSLAVGLSALIVDILLYTTAQEVVLLGVLAMALGFMVYDMLNLGTVGLQLFVLFFDLVAVLFFWAFPTQITIYYPRFFPVVGGFPINVQSLLPSVLILSSAAIGINLLMDVFVIKRTNYIA
ncbi:APC family permease [Thermoplasmatales archaeon AK]|nr:APC family permease [Thermoplasmatales archaeon AK]